MPDAHRIQAIEKILAARRRGRAHPGGRLTKSPAIRSVLARRPLPKRMWSRKAVTVRRPESVRALALHKARQKGR